MSSILLVCNDDVLRNTRAILLRQTGATIFSCESHQAIQFQRDSVCEVVVLCHSLPETVFTNLAETILGEWPDTKTLLIMPQCDVGFLARVVSGVESVSSDPSRLLQRVRGLLSAPSAARPNSYSPSTGLHLLELPVRAGGTPGV